MSKLQYSPCDVLVSKQSSIYSCRSSSIPLYTSFGTPEVNLAYNILKSFSYFAKKIGHNISCELCPDDTIHMKCQALFFFWGNSMLSADLPRMLKVKVSYIEEPLSLNSYYFIVNYVEGK